MGVTIDTMDPEIADRPVFLVTRRELAVLTVALALVASSILLLLVTGSRLISALLGPG